MLEDLFQTVKTRFDFDGNQNTPKKKKNTIPENLLFKCSRCGQVTFMDEFLANHKVCQNCEYHSRLTARERLTMTIDRGSLQEFDASMDSKNPIEFEGYQELLEKNQDKTGLRDAVITGSCTIKGKHCVVIVMDSHFMMASMGSVVGEKITRSFEYATEHGLPVIAFTASGGARMQEGIVSLMQMAKTSAAVKRHSDAGGLYITVMTDPTTGGVTASFASLGDIIIAEPKVLIGFAGRRVIEGTIKQRLPDDFQSAEFLLEHGFVDMIVPRVQMRHTLSKLLRHHGYQD